MATKLNKDQMQAYWGKTSNLMWTILALWFFFSFVVHFFAPTLNGIRILGFPLGFYMAAQGSLIAFLLMCFYNARAQNAIDEEFGVSDE
jgi:putative solute:sodium symporter small subunit